MRYQTVLYIKLSFAERKFLNLIFALVVQPDIYRIQRYRIYAKHEMFIKLFKELFFF